MNLLFKDRSGFSQVARGAEQFREHPSTIKHKRCRNVSKMTLALWSFFYKAKRHSVARRLSLYTAFSWVESGVQDFCGRIIQDWIGEPPWEYNFLINLDESEYPRYLAKLFFLNTGEKLPLAKELRINCLLRKETCSSRVGKAFFGLFNKSKNNEEAYPRRQCFGNYVIDKNKCRTFNQKIQWIKLYGVTDLMRQCTDKVAVRDYVREKIGEEYLKPVLQIIPSGHSENVENQNDNSVDFRVVQNLTKEKSQDIAMLKHACIDNNIKNENNNYTTVQHDSLQVGQVIPDNSQQSSHVIASKSVSIQDLRSNPADRMNNNNQPDCHVAIAPRNDRPLGALLPNSDDVTTYFDQINFDKLPNAFVIKCNHGCKWQYIIKDKEKFLNTPQLFEIVKKNITGWLEQEFFPWNGFEMQYKGIEPKILIEPLLREEINKPVREIEVYCFNGKPKIFVNVRYGNKREISYYDEKFNQIDLLLHPDGNNVIVNEKADDYVNQMFDLYNQNNKSISMEEISRLSTELSKDFIFVRVDWFVFSNKLYFNEITFTPYSGLMKFDKKWNKKLGSWIEL